jgi:uncharacterized membrane protein YfcA
MIPLLTERIGMSRFEARGTAMAASFFTAVSGIVTYGLHGDVDWRTLLWTHIITHISAKLEAPRSRTR